VEKKSSGAKLLHDICIKQSPTAASRLNLRPPTPNPLNDHTPLLSSSSKSQKPAYTVHAMASFATLPPTADNDAIKPFKVSIPESDLQEMKTLIKLSKVAVPSFENTHTGEENEHYYGIDREFIVKAKKVWEGEYDW
jgi:Epoxide hydrolase N terminus